jgi:hypothetical protein
MTNSKLPFAVPRLAFVTPITLQQLLIISQRVYGVHGAICHLSSVISFELQARMTSGINFTLGNAKFGLGFRSDGKERHSAADRYP